MNDNHGSLLVVDDDQHILEAMADYLRGLGHRTETASTCQHAIERMAEFPFEIASLSRFCTKKEQRQIIERASEGTLFGETFFFDGVPRSEDAIASTEAILRPDVIARSASDEAISGTPAHPQDCLTALSRPSGCAPTEAPG